MSLPDIYNVAAENVSFFTPAQIPPPGTIDDTNVPKLFQPLKIRGVEFQNRIFLSPLCQYSSEDGYLTPWHIAHLGGILSRGPGLTMVEATSVLPEGRITPQDAGLWKDDQIESYRKVVEFSHSQNQKIGIQLAHAGRKASMAAPWLGTHISSVNVGGWPDNVFAPSAIAWDAKHPNPKELSITQIKEVVKAFQDSARRALKAGFDIIEIHNAHGYLLHEFISPYSNKRTDQYGGSFENRTRLTLEIVDAVRDVIPDTMPLFLRISASDLIEQALPNEPSWRIEDTIKLAHILAEHGVDLLDVSAAGNAKEQVFQAPNPEKPAFQAHFAEAVKNDVGNKLLVSAVGGINSAKIAEAILEDGQVDVVFAGRWFQRDPALVWKFAEELGVKIYMDHQIGWPFVGTLARTYFADSKLRAGLPAK